MALNFFWVLPWITWGHRHSRFSVCVLSSLPACASVYRFSFALFFVLVSVVSLFDFFIIFTHRPPHLFVFCTSSSIALLLTLLPFLLLPTHYPAIHTTSSNSAFISTFLPVLKKSDSFSLHLFSFIFTSLPPTLSSHEERRPKNCQKSLR